MPNQSVQKKYNSAWKTRLLTRGRERFLDYERNWVLPPLFRREEKVLDLGSGNSIVGEYLHKQLNCQVTALDISPAAIRAARYRGVRGIVGSVEEKLPFPANSFDTVFWGDNIEHILFPAKVLAEIHRVLKSSGRVILSTPNQAYWRYRWSMFRDGALPKTEGEANEPWDWEHIRFFNRPILARLLTHTGFRETNFRGVSRRRIDRLFLSLSPSLFGMIMVVEARKV